MHFVHVYSAQQLRVLFAHMYILPNKAGCILHTFIYCSTSQGAYTCLFCLTSQGAFCRHLYPAQRARVHFASKYILPSKPECILHLSIFCPTSQDALCTCLFHPATQGPFCIYVYSAQQARVHFAYI